MLPGQMSTWLLESVQDVPRSLYLKLHHNQVLRYSWYGQMSREQNLPGQMLPLQLESVLDVHRNLPLEFHQNRVRSWKYYPLKLLHFWRFLRVSPPLFYEFFSKNSLLSSLSKQKIASKATSVRQRIKTSWGWAVPSSAANWDFVELWLRLLSYIDWYEMTRHLMLLYLLSRATFQFTPF